MSWSMQPGDFDPTLNAPGAGTISGNGQSRMPQVRGRLTPQAALDKLVWFKSGGPADWLFEPADLDDLRSEERRVGKQ